MNHHRDSFYIDGSWVAPRGQETVALIDPSTERPYGHVPEGTAADLDSAVSAARSAFPSWSALPMGERAEYLRALADGLNERRAELAELVTREVGIPVSIAQTTQVDPFVNLIYRTADFADGLAVDSIVNGAHVAREAIGVVGCIIPWNVPLLMVTSKALPGVAVGCTLVLKPSELAPLMAFAVAEVAHEVGFPRGVINIITGEGAMLGEAMCTHPDIDMIVFTGSTSTGRLVAAGAAQTIKRTVLELGGKSACVVLRGADLESAVRGCVQNAFRNAGQTCTAQTRLLIPSEDLPEAEKYARDAVLKIVQGDPWNTESTMGPLISRQQKSRVLAYIQSALDEGAELIVGGSDASVPPQGYFVAPTVFSSVTTSMQLAREEVFGPVIAMMPYETEQEAIEIANDSIYGLSGAVWAADDATAIEVARQIRTGQVFINGAKINHDAPFGGYKQSGIGREMGEAGLLEFMESKSIMV